MGTMSQDLARSLDALEASVTKRDALRAARHLLAIAGELTGAITLVAATVAATGAAGALLGPLGVTVGGGLTAKAVQEALAAYERLDSADRAQARIVLAYARRLAIAV